MEDGDLGAAMLGSERAVPTSRLGRLLGTGRSAIGLASTALGRRDGSVDLAAMTRLTSRLGELKGVAMKMGQVLSFIDPSMPAETRGLLSLLQRQAPASETEAIAEVVRGAFGAFGEELLAAMDPRPFAVASIGQVHRAKLPDIGEVAIKVRHPGIERALEADFAAARAGLGIANTLLFGAASDAAGFMDEARAAMLGECDFRQEASSQRAFAEWFADDDTLIIPRVVDAWSAEAVLTTAWEPGLTLEQFVAGGPSQAERDRAGRALFCAAVGGFHGLGLLHADPHPGNFAFRDGRVVLYDFGCVRRFAPEHTRAFATMARALRDGDRRGLVGAAQDFGFRVRSAAQEALLERFARGFFAPLLVRGPSTIPPDGAFEATQMLKDKRAMMKLGLPPHLLFVLRLRFGLYAVLSQLGACQDWGALEEAAAA
jgi:predicted unusual protein kinase regulating ubiquinone biosynthesis (AarF/ABC1/UbiB family)